MTDTLAPIVLQWLAFGLLVVVVGACYATWRCTKISAFLLMGFANLWAWAMRLALHLEEAYGWGEFLRDNWRAVNLPVHVLNAVAFVWLAVSLSRIYHRNHNGRRDDPQ